MTHKRNILSAVNEGLKNSDIKVFLGVGDDGDWDVKIDTTEHDKHVRAEIIESELNKFTKEYTEKIRAEVIDKFFNNIKNICNKNCNECIFCIDETCEIACIKEKLKGGLENNVIKNN